MATHTNQIAIKGNLTRDPEMRITNNGASLLTFSIANNRSYKAKGSDEWTEETSFFDVTVWGDLAEDAINVLEKGLEVTVQGRLKQDTWETPEGDKRSKVGLVADEISVSVRAMESLVRKQRGAGGSSNSSSPQRTASPAVEPF